MKKLLPLLILLACTTTKSLPPQDAFFDALKEHCGKAYEGRVAQDSAPSPDFQKRLIMHVSSCSENEIKIPFHVGEDHSRTWIITKTGKGLRLKHDHRQKNGSPDESTMYGGDTSEMGSANVQSFPADEYSKKMFIAHKIPQSVFNVWKIHVYPDVFSYQLKRTNSDRNFKVDFDLTKVVATPPAPWGDE